MRFLALAGLLVLALPAHADMYPDASNAKLPDARANLGLGTLSMQNANGVTISGSALCSSTFTMPAPGVRAPLFIQNDCAPAQISAGYNVNIQSWLGYFPTATPAAGDAVNMTLSVDNLNGRKAIWALNLNCYQFATGMTNGYGHPSGLPAGSGSVSCEEIDVFAGQPVANPADPFSGPTPARGLEISASAPDAGANPHVAILTYANPTGEPLKNALTTTGNTHSNTTIDNLASNAGIWPGMQVIASGFPAGTIVASVNPAGTSVVTNNPSTSTLTGTSVIFQTISGNWWDHVLSCANYLYSCVVSAQFSTEFNGNGGGGQGAFLWDKGGSANVLRVDGSHPQSVINLAGWDQQSAFVQGSVTTKTQLSFVNGADFDVRLELNSGLTAAHNSAIRFTDRNFDRWDIIKNNGNALIVFDIPNSVSLLELDPTDVIQMRGPLVMATAGGIVPFATTVASLPACSTGGTLKGAIFNVTDANATTFNAVAAGGGSNFMQVVCDGTSWRLH